MEEMEPTVVIQPIIFKNLKFITNSTAMAEQETDSVIIFNGKHRIPINKSLMVERCTFFKYMTKHGFKEANAKEISINYNTDVTVFKALVDYIHTGEIRLTTANLEAVIVAAIYFQLHALLKFCCDVMMKNTDLKTVGQVYEFAKEFALVELRKAAVASQVKHFNEISESTVFYEWLAAFMLELLSSDEVEVSHEKKVLKFVFDWLNVDPNGRGEHAAELFRKLRFTFLNEKIINEVLGENTNEKLGQIFHVVASEFDKNITPPRTYDKGLYLYGYNCETSELLGDRGFRFVRYCPDDGNITVLNTPNISPTEKRIDIVVVNNKNIFMLFVNEQDDSLKIHMQKYDTKMDLWKSNASTTIASQLRFCNGLLCACDNKIFAFFNAVDGETHEVLFFCMMYCVKTNTWERLPVFEGNLVAPATTCGDSIYMTRCGSNNLLQYKPSTGELIDIPCQYDLRPWAAKAITYKSNVLFLPNPGLPNLAVLFKTEPKEFRRFDFIEVHKIYRTIGKSLQYSVFRDFVIVFTKYSEIFFKFDLSFNDESKEPNLIPLPDIIEMKMDIYYIASIQ